MTRPREQTIISTSAIFLFFVLMQITTWIPLRFWKIWSGVNYFDLNLVLNWSNCFQKLGNFIYEKPMNGTSCTGYIYGSSLIRFLDAAGIGSRHTLLLGFIFMFLLALTISIILVNQTSISPPPLYFLILSPPTILLAELGNFDTVMVFLVLHAGIFLSKNQYIMALTMVALATLMKFYTIPLFFVLILFSKNKWQRLTTIIVGSLVGIRVFADLKLIKSDFPSGFYEQFGASIWPKYLENSHFKGFGDSVNFVIGIVIFLFLYFCVEKFLRNNYLSLDEKYTGCYRERILFYFLFGTHLTCYFAGINFDHRLIFFSLSSLIFLNNFSEYGSKFSNLLTLLVIVAVWITFPAPGLEPIGDLALEIASILMLTKMASLLKIDLSRVMDLKFWKFATAGN